MGVVQEGTPACRIVRGEGGEIASGDGDTGTWAAQGSKRGEVARNTALEGLGTTSRGSAVLYDDEAPRYSEAGSRGDRLRKPAVAPQGCPDLVQSSKPL